MEALKESLKRNANGWVRAKAHAEPATNLSTVEHRIKGNDMLKPELAKAGPIVFLAVTMTLFVWIVGTLLFVTVNKRRVYRDEINKRLHYVTRVSAPRLSSNSRKTWFRRIAEREKTNSRPRLACRTIGG